jgi:predicted outer membrane repeat protein
VGDSNNAVSGGGAVAIAYRYFTILNTDFLFCESRVNKDGGSICVYNACVSFINCSFLNCISSGNGGGFGCLKDSVKEIKFADCIFGSNVANGNGGAINNYLPYLTCEGCSFFHNMAVTKGGAINAENDVTLTNVVIIRNIKMEVVHVLLMI